MEEGNYHKFTKAKGGPEKMMRMLLDTGDRELVEVRLVLSLFAHIAKLISPQASPTDRIWGVGFGAANAGENREQWGENRLGKAMMAVRDRLRAEGQR